MMYKYANGLLPDVMNELYTPNNEIHSYYTRQCNMLHLNKGTINVYTKSFRFISSLIWNYIQTKFDVNVPISKFKKVFKLYLQNNDIQLLYPK